MAYECKIVKDSLAPNGARLTTFEITYPLIIHNELMTHRMLSRNTASNRAIPVQKMIDSVRSDPFIPERWPRNQAGMQNEEWLNEREAAQAREGWMAARNAAVDWAEQLRDYGVHKQITNRLLGPFLWTTAVVTATEWANFFNLRCHAAAQPEMKRIADMMQYSYCTNVPRPLKQGEWHLPYVSALEDDRQELIKGPNVDGDQLLWLPLVSAGRCAGVSYLRQGEEKPGIEAYTLSLKLYESGHWSPFEHQAMALDKHEGPIWYGNFRGFMQYRKLFKNENQRKFKPNLPQLIGSGYDKEIG